MEEREWVEKAKKGDRNALNSLISANYQILAGYVAKMAGNREQAQDIVQDTLLKAIEHLNYYQPHGKFSTWLIKIATNRVRDEWRKERPVDILLDTVPMEGDGPEEEIVKKMEYKEALEILHVLPPEKRMIFILKHYYGYKYEEIAEIVQCPLGTVRSRLHFCVKRIMEEVERREQSGETTGRKGKTNY